MLKKTNIYDIYQSLPTISKLQMSRKNIYITILMALLSIFYEIKNHVITKIYSAAYTNKIINIQIF